MSLTGRFAAGIARRFGFVRAPQRRGYGASQINRLTGDWLATIKSGDAEIRYSLKNLRGRSRELAMNNGYMKKYLRMCVVNIVGPNGITFQNKAKNTRQDKTGKTVEELDVPANRRIEEAFDEWARRASVCGRHSFKTLQKMFVASVARDGECLVRVYRGAEAGNRFNFALQLIESDHLDENYNAELQGGNSIRMSIEFSPQMRPVAYHLLTKHPGDYAAGSFAAPRERVPADEIIHGYDPERSSQSRGVPWAHAVMGKLNMTGAYEETELVAARVGAAKMGFFVPDPESGATYTGTDEENGDVITEAEPGTFEQLPAGLKFEKWDPTHPAGNFPFFVKMMLRGIASGLNVAYNSLASDLENVNYSSIRSGSIEERDNWRLLQGWMVDVFCQPVFDLWLDSALMFGAVNLPYEKMDKFNRPKWALRGWQWVDPMKDVKANIEAVNAGLSSRNHILSEQGLDVEEIFEELSEEKKLADGLGLDFKIDKTVAVALPAEPAPDNTNNQ